MARLNINLTHRGIILVSVPLIFELVLLVMFFMQVNQAQKELEHNLKMREIVSTAAHIYTDVTIAAWAVGGYKYSQLNADVFLTRYKQRVRAVTAQLDSLDELAKDDPPERDQVSAFRRLVNDELELLSQAEHLDASPINEGPGALVSAFHSLRLYEGIRARAEALERQLARLSATAGKSADILKIEDEKRETLKQSIIAGAALNVLLAVGLALFFSKGVINRLNVLMDNSLRLAARKPLNPLLSGNDEIAHLDKVFHETAAALEEASRKVRAIIDNAVDVICSIDDNGVFTEVSPSAGTTWGYDADDLIGKRYVSLIAQPDVEATIKNIEEMKETGATKIFENRVLRRDGTVVSTLWSCCWSEKDQSIICVAHDISQRKKLEQLKQEFVAMISHDLRTPLASFQAFLEGMDSGVYDDRFDRAKKRAHVMKDDVSRLINMVTSLLELEKMEAGMRQLFCETFPIERLFERSIESVRSLAEKKNITLESHPIASSIYADEEQLVQVVINLVSNAIKFSPSDETVEIRAAENKGQLHISITDHGAGIAAEHRQKIFDRYEQITLDDSRLRKGTGLGLAICKAIVEAHNGTIGVESEFGKGSTFWFAIPLTTEPATSTIESPSITDAR